MSNVDREALKEQGWTEEGAKAIEAGLDPDTLPAPPSLSERLAQAVIVAEPWTDEYREYVESLKRQFSEEMRVLIHG